MTYRAPVDADVAALIEVAAEHLDDTPAPSVDQIRDREARFHTWLRGELEPALSLVPTRDEEVGGVRVRWYGDVPRDDSDVIVYLHGGGWLAGDIDSYDPDVRRLSLSLDRPVVAVDYRRTPEHPFPAAIDDCLSFLRVLRERPHRSLSLAGDSAGANLALGTAIEISADQPLTALLLLYPVVDPAAFENQSYVDNGSGYLLTADAMRSYWDHYVRTEEHRSHPSAAPSLASLDGLPGTVVVSADYDPLRDENRELTLRLVDADVPTTYLPNPGLTHGFQQMVPRVPAAAEALERAYRAFAVAIENGTHRSVRPSAITRIAGRQS